MAGYTKVADGGLGSSKAKAALGVPADHTITWVPLDLNHIDNQVLRNVAKARGVKAQDVPVKALKGWFEKNRKALEEESTKYLKLNEKSEDDLKKEALAAAARFERLMEELKSRGIEIPEVK